MESFYGGKQGHSYKIVAHYNSIYDMVQAFQGGGAYTAVNYDEYVIIDTVIERNQKNNLENGILYRRGYNFSEEFNPSSIPLNDTNTTLSPYQLTPLAVTLYADELDVEYEYGDLASGDYSVSVRVPKYYDFSYRLYDDGEGGIDYEIIINSDGFHTDQWNDDWGTFVEHPGGGAEYIGQIVGPQGDTPAIEVISWGDYREYTSEGAGTSESIRGQTVVDPVPGYNAAAAGLDGYDIDGFHDEIRYAYCTLRDLEGNITGSYISFDIPYAVFRFDAESISPYDTTYGIYDEDTQTWSYLGLVSEESDSIGHPFYKHYKFRVPTGIHGQDIYSLHTKYYNATDPEVVDKGDDIENGKWLVYQTKTYNETGEPVESEEIPIDPYKVITSIDVNYRGTAAAGVHQYPFQTIIHYSYGANTVLDLNSVERIWRQDVSENGLLINHLYAVMAQSDNPIDLGLIREVYSIEKDSTDQNIYTYFNYDTAEERLAKRTLLPIAEISDMRLQGDLVLIRYKNVPNSFYTTSGIPTYTDPNTGAIWFNLGSCVKGNHVYANFTTEAELLSTFPYGLGYDQNGDVDPTTQDRMGWTVTVGSDNLYSIYAYDYLTNAWYKMQELGAEAVKPYYSMIMAPATDFDQPDSPNVASLQQDGYWFVMSE